MLITSTSRNNKIYFKGRLSERKQTMLRNNYRKIKTIWQKFGKQLKTWVCHAKFPISQSICLRENNLLQFTEKKNANTFKDFYSKLAADSVNQLPAAKKIFLGWQVFTNYVYGYDRACNMHTNGISSTQKFMQCWFLCDST